MLARFLVRADEAAASADLLRHLLASTPTGRTATSLPENTGRGAHRSGTGIVEAWRGTIAHRKSFNLSYAGNDL